MQTVRELRVRAVRVSWPSRVANCPDRRGSHQRRAWWGFSRMQPQRRDPQADMIRNFEPLLRGNPLAPGEIHCKPARRFRLLGTIMALAAIDMALGTPWRAAMGCPPTRLLGAVERPLRAYGAEGSDVRFTMGRDRTSALVDRPPPPPGSVNDGAYSIADKKANVFSLRRSEPRGETLDHLCMSRYQVRPDSAI
jgi:hypothetical protein